MEYMLAHARFVLALAEWRAEREVDRPKAERSPESYLDEAFRNVPWPRG